MWKIILFVSVYCSACYAEKIIIIGAGAAGIAAASKLLDENISDFTILEAENRIGGRIHSFYLGNAYVDLGAQFVHGQKGNIAYQLAKNYVKPGPTVNDVVVYYMGHSVTEDNLLQEFESIYDGVAVPENINSSIGKVFLEKYSSVLLKYKDNPDKYLYAKNLIKTAECLILGLEGSYSWFSPTCYPSFQEAEGDQTMSWDGLGYKTILDILLKNFPNKNGYNIDKQISFGKIVSKITLKENSVKVKCTDGSEYIGEHVIFTPSLGVLKHDHQKIFEPSLSDQKIRAITDLGIDGVMKIIFEFPNTWWENEKHFAFVWTEEDRKNVLKDVPFGPTKDGEHWLSWFPSLGIAPNNPKILIGWLYGPLLPEVEKLTEQEMKNATTYVIKKFLGARFNVTEPTKVIHSKWVTNPNIRGTYSYDTIKSSINQSKPSTRAILLEPIPGKDGVPRILFAGEATSVNRSSTVDGAIGSGFREAERLISILKK